MGTKWAQPLIEHDQSFDVVYGIAFFSTPATFRAPLHCASLRHMAIAISACVPFLPRTSW